MRPLAFLILAPTLTPTLTLTLTLTPTLSPTLSLTLTHHHWIPQPVCATARLPHTSRERRGGWCVTLWVTLWVKPICGRPTLWVRRIYGRPTLWVKF